jgi:hypothetical protein
LRLGHLARAARENRLFPLSPVSFMNSSFRKRKVIQSSNPRFLGAALWHYHARAPYLKKNPLICDAPISGRAAQVSIHAPDQAGTAPRDSQKPEGVKRNFLRCDIYTPATLPRRGSERTAIE